MSFLERMQHQGRIKDAIKHDSGATIYVTDDYRFYPVVDNDDSPPQFQTLSAAEGYITERLAAKAKAAKVKIALPVLLESTGKAAIITGINANTSDLNGVDGERTVYPQVPWISAALKRKAELNAEVEAISKKLQPFRIHGSRGYGRMGGAKYDDTVKALVSEHADKLKAAQKVTS